MPTCSLNILFVNQDSDEEDDGTYIEEIGDTNVLREKDHLQMQSMEYGTIQSQETSLDAEDKFHLDSDSQVQP